MAEITHHQPKQVQRVQGDENEAQGGPVTSSRQRKVRMTTEDSIHKFASAILAELEKQAMHPAMEAQKARAKARMDDKDGDGKKEPDTEELTAKERFAKMKKTAGRTASAVGGGLIGGVAASAGASRGRRLRSGLGAVAGGLAGSALGAAGGPAGSMAGAMAGGAAGAHLAHGKTPHKAIARLQIAKQKAKTQQHKDTLKHGHVIAKAKYKAAMVKHKAEYDKKQGKES